MYIYILKSLFSEHHNISLLCTCQQQTIHKNRFPQVGCNRQSTKLPGQGKGGSDRVEESTGSGATTQEGAHSGRQDTGGSSRE